MKRKCEFIYRLFNEPKGTDTWLNTNKIVVPKSFQQTPPNPSKLITCTKILTNLGRLDTPISVKQVGNKYYVIDGYIRYLIGRDNLNLSKLPVTFVN